MVHTEIDNFRVQASNNTINKLDSYSIEIALPFLCDMDGVERPGYVERAGTHLATR